jgi:hypothetical protein
MKFLMVSTIQDHDTMPKEFSRLVDSRGFKTIFSADHSSCYSTVLSSHYQELLLMVNLLWEKTLVI